MERRNLAIFFHELPTQSRLPDQPSPRGYSVAASGEVYIAVRVIGTVGSARKTPCLQQESYYDWIVRNNRTFRFDLQHKLGGENLT